MLTLDYGNGTGEAEDLSNKMKADRMFFNVRRQYQFGMERVVVAMEKIFPSEEE